MFLDGVWAVLLISKYKSLAGVRLRVSLGVRHFPKNQNQYESTIEQFWGVSSVNSKSTLEQFWVVSSVNSKLLLVVLLMAFEQNWSKIEEITHPSTNRPQCCLTYLIIDLVVMFFGYWLFIGYLVKILDIKNQYFLFLLKEIISLMQIKDYNRLISFFFFLFRGIL